MNNLKFKLCIHNDEWEAYHRITKAEIFDPIHVEYDRQHPTMSAKNNFHFVLINGTEVIGTAQIEFIDANTAAIRVLATDRGLQRQGFGTYMLKQLEKWVKSQGRNTIKLHARLDTEFFYRKAGYIEMTFDGPSISKEIINLGKIL